MNKDSDEQKESNQSACVASAGLSAGKGRSINPADLPADDDSPTQKKPRHIPLGLPISDKEYDKLKEKAKKERPSSENIGQQDSNA
jgi:hypothetical protein